LLPKETTDLDDENNWRPLTILRLVGFCIRCNRNPFSEQPGASMMPRCRGLSGTSLVTLLASMFVYNLSITLDIVSGLQLFSSSRSVVSYFIDAVVELYTDASTHFTLAKVETPKIPMTRGVKQGDPLSPLLFNVANAVIEIHFPSNPVLQ
jgi:hypothetical protein